MTEPDPVPTYTAQPGPTDLPEDQHERYINQNNDPYPVKRWPRPSSNPSSETVKTQREVVLRFFSAIATKDYDVVATMLESKLVIPETTDVSGQTPLIEATAQGNTRMVQELLDFEADVDGFGVYGIKSDAPMRTPLMVAAATGNLTLVKLLVEVYHADDALISPDGQLALRLAAEAGHKEIVDFLPLRRGGGWRRWKTHHAKAFRRIKRAFGDIRLFLLYCFWYIPKALLWDLPRWGVVLPIVHYTKWCWRNKHFFAPWCKRKVEEIPEKTRKAVTWLQKGLITVGKRAKKFFIDDIPTFLRSLPGRVWKGVQWIWHFLTVRIPSALKVCVLWLCNGVKNAFEAIMNLIHSIASLMHTIVIAIASFFRSITLRDIWNGFCHALEAVFIRFPQQIWNWLCKFGDTSYKVLKYVAGETGRALWWIGWCCGWLVVYIPRKIWIIISSLGGSIVKGVKELRVWMNPKAV